MTELSVRELLVGVDLEQLREAFALALPWLKAVTAGDLAATEAVGSELMLTSASRDHQLLVHGVTGVAVVLFAQGV